MHSLPLPYEQSRTVLEPEGSDGLPYGLRITLDKEFDAVEWLTYLDAQITKIRELVRAYLFVQVYTKKVNEYPSDLPCSDHNLDWHQLTYPDVNTAINDPVALLRFTANLVLDNDEIPASPQERAAFVQTIRRKRARKFSGMTLENREEQAMQQHPCHTAHLEHMHQTNRALFFGNGVLHEAIERRPYYLTHMTGHAHPQVELVGITQLSRRAMTGKIRKCWHYDGRQEFITAIYDADFWKLYDKVLQKRHTLLLDATPSAR